MARILIIEDEADLAVSLDEDFCRQGHDVTVARDGMEGLARGLEGPWDLVLLDVMLPRMDGFDVCAALRKANVSTPVIMLTARSQEADKELGLDSGADDYVSKPFSLRELRARVRAQLRRSNRQPAQLHRIGDCVVDLDRGEVRRGGSAIDVTAQELKLLGALLHRRGRLLTRDQIITAAWGHSVAITDRAVDSHVYNLRRKIEPVPAEPRYLIGVRGMGYRLEEGN